MKITYYRKRGELPWEAVILPQDWSPVQNLLEIPGNEEVVVVLDGGERVRFCLRDPRIGMVKETLEDLQNLAGGLLVTLADSPEARNHIVEDWSEEIFRIASDFQSMLDEIGGP